MSINQHRLNTVRIQDAENLVEANERTIRQSNKSNASHIITPFTAHDEHIDTQETKHLAMWFRKL